MESESQMKILKFGAGCLKGPEQISAVKDIVALTARQQPVAVVLSALAGTTDLLAASTVEAEGGDESYHDQVAGLLDRHLQAVRVLFPPREHASVITAVQLLINELEEILHGVELIRECSPRTLDLVLSFGERLSCTLVAAYLRQQELPARMVDARELIFTDNRHGKAVVDFQQSYTQIRRRLASREEIPVITGFIASTAEGVTTTLGENGADYTASLIAAGLQAGRIEIWTDQEGVMSADPAFVKEAFMIPALSYQEAMELSYFGARIIHPYTMVPALEQDIPMVIKNILRPEDAGTLIAREVQPQPHAITGIACIDDISLVNVEGGGMIGLKGIAARIFGALARATVNVIMISQASSEHSICLGFKEKNPERVLDALRQELSVEIAAKRVEDFTLLENMVIIAVIGENMRGTPGLSGRLFSALGNAGINVFAIAQGSSERNISFMIRAADKAEALRTIHNAFLRPVSRA
jgi:aspartokinase/homoserine dehydrogenase 1